MTARQVEDKLVEKYPAFLKETMELADIIQYLSRYDEDSISRIWDSFRLNYGYATAPRLAAFHTASKECGATMKSGEGRRYEFVCYVCGARYQIDRTTCPNCSNSDKTWRSLISEGKWRSGQLKREIEEEREMAHNERNRK